MKKKYIYISVNLNYILTGFHVAIFNTFKRKSNPTTGGGNRIGVVSNGWRSTRKIVVKIERNEDEVLLSPVTSQLVKRLVVSWSAGRNNFRPEASFSTPPFTFDFLRSSLSFLSANSLNCPPTIMISSPRENYFYPRIH